MTNNMNELLYSPASSFRLFWAFYIDFCLLSIVLNVVHFYFSNHFSLLNNHLFMLMVSVFLVIFLEWLLINYFKVQSLGFKALGISAHPGKDSNSKDSNKFIVDRNIKENENWVTMFIGLMLINDGCKQTIRWILNLKLPPLFGISIDEPWGMMLSVLIGFFSIKIGIDILRLRIWSAYAFLGYYLTIIFGVLLAYPQVMDWSKSQMMLISTQSNKALSSSEIKMMSSAIINSLVICATIMSAFIFKNLHRFKN